VLDSLCRNAALVQFGVNKRGIFAVFFRSVSPGRRFSILSISPNAALCHASSAVLCDLAFLQRGFLGSLWMYSFNSLYRTGGIVARHLERSHPVSAFLPLEDRF